jgi:hypothetical protein
MMTALEQQFLRKPLKFIPFFAVSAVLLFLAASYRNRLVSRLSGLRYEAESLPGLVLLELSRKPF